MKTNLPEQVGRNFGALPAARDGSTDIADSKRSSAPARLVSEQEMYTNCRGAF
jgi:hypothetical protein